jgi:MYXO-CTERM domain-containing protein
MPDDGGDGGCGCGPTRPGHPAAGLLAGLALLLALSWRRRHSAGEARRSFSEGGASR